MNVDSIADRRLKKHGLSLPPDDELHLVGEMIDDAVKRRMGVLGPNGTPTPLGAAEMAALADVMAKAAVEAVSSQMAELITKVDVLSSQVAFMTNMLCHMSAEKAKQDRPAGSKWRPWAKPTSL